MLRNERKKLLRYVPYSRLNQQKNNLQEHSLPPLQQLVQQNWKDEKKKALNLHPQVDFALMERPTLDTLPMDVLERICSLEYLAVGEANALARVSKRFYKASMLTETEGPRPNQEHVVADPKDLFSLCRLLQVVSIRNLTLRVTRCPHTGCATNACWPKLSSKIKTGELEELTIELPALWRDYLSHLPLVFTRLRVLRMKGMRSLSSKSSHRWLQDQHAFDKFVECLEPLQNSPTLEELSIAGIVFTDTKPLTMMIGMPALQKLTLDECCFVSEGISYIPFIDYEDFHIPFNFPIFANITHLALGPSMQDEVHYNNILQRLPALFPALKTLELHFSLYNSDSEYVELSKHETRITLRLMSTHYTQSYMDKLRANMTNVDVVFA
jgi:hypothetical protein